MRAALKILVGVIAGVVLAIYVSLGTAYTIFLGNVTNRWLPSLYYGITWPFQAVRNLFHKR
jgi:hypothetical protein